jgi:predicted transcriptional regulator
VLGPFLKRLRARGDRDVVAVAEHLGVSRAAVYMWEADDRRPEPEQLGRLLDLYVATDVERLEAWRLRSLPRNEDGAAA